MGESGHGVAHHRTIIVQIITRPRPGFYLSRACSPEPMHTGLGPQPSNLPNCLGCLPIHMLQPFWLLGFVALARIHIASICWACHCATHTQARDLQSLWGCFHASSLRWDPRDNPQASLR
ncbi:hypothetical protein ACFX1X_032537 [Malus domestica]